MLTVREMLDAFLRHVGESGDDNARLTALDCLNYAYQELNTLHEWQDLRSPTPLRLTLTAGRSRYALPSHVARVIPPVRNLTRGSTMTAVDPNAAADAFPQAGTATAEVGAPTCYSLAGIVGVRQQPAPAGQLLHVVSSDAADSNVTVTVAGDDVNGEKRERTVTLAGTSPVECGTWSYIDSFSKALANLATAATLGTSSVGTVSLRIVTSLTVLQALDPQESAREHKVLQFFPQPDAADLIALPFIQRPRQLVEGSDPVPGDWAPALFESMEIRYRRNTGELTIKDNPPRPALLRLIEADNRLKERPTTRPFRL